MPSLSSILGNPLTDVMKAAGEIIGRFVTDPAAKLAAQQQLVAVQASFSEKLLAADVEFAKAQAETISAEAKSESCLARNWRPILMLTFTYIIAHNFIIAPLFSLPSLPIPEQMWELLKLGVGGYILGRSGEKIATSAATAFAAKHDE